MPTAELRRRWAWPALGLVLAGGLGLRLWGVAQGLPYAYNTDEADHFVPRAVAMFGHDLNPHYFANPPAFTYVLHYLFAVAYGGKTGVRHALAFDPTEVYTLARIAAAVLGVAALWLLYATGARLFGRAVGLLAAAIEAVAFLPVFYSHLALNDVPTLAPLTLSLLGSAGVLSKGRKRDYLLAGGGLGLACASKYTAGIVIAPFVAVLAARYLDGNARAGRDALVGIAICAAAALLAFLIANPYSLLDYHSFHHELVHQSTLSAEAQGKLGAPRNGGLAYYLWALTWGLGWLPALAALGGAIAIWRRGQRYGWMLVPAPLLFLAFMGLQGRYFGRWLLPIFPLLCLLAAVFVLWSADLLGLLAARALSARRAADLPAGGRGAGPTPRRRLGIVFAALLGAAVLAQGLVFSVHSGLVLARADTRNLTRAWMVANVPGGSKIVAEPVSPDEWARERKPGTSTAANPYRWSKYPSLLSRISPNGALLGHGFHIISIENYERTLSPALVGYYERHGYCTVISGSTQSGRAVADRAEAPLALAYYATLRERADMIFRSTPYRSRGDSVPFGFDWSFDYYPLAYHRPGPAIVVYRLRGGRCAR
jgi:4-amino-4-deoxy-L-arabinose transferase-like glycosyltransferase